MRLERHHACAQLGPGPDAVTEVCAYIEAQVAGSDEGRVYSSQRSMVKWHAIVYQERKREAQGSLTRTEEALKCECHSGSIEKCRG